MLINRVILISLRCALACIVIALSGHDLKAQNLEVKFFEELRIGDDENASEEYLFADPQHIGTDSKNNIYIADRQIAEVRVFDRNGRFIRRIGRKGQGPGEFQDITSMVVDHHDDLIIVDRLNRRFTRFINMGENFKIYPMPDQSFIDPYCILPLSWKAFVIYYPSRSKSRRETQSDDKMLHIYSADFTSIQESLAPAGEIWDLNQPFLKAQAQANALNMTVIDTNRIVVAPKFYEGILYCYEKKNNSWQLFTLKGEIPPTQSYIQREFNQQSVLNEMKVAGSSGISSMVFNKGGDKFFIYVNNRSVGLFRLENNKIVHFSFINDGKNKAILGVDMFGKNGEHVGYGPVRNFLLKGNPIFSIEVLWKDKDDRFYVCDTREFSMIRIVRLQYHVLKK
jgi:hypothetical protein